jgi:hypothetical protein
LAGVGGRLHQADVHEQSLFELPLGLLHEIGVISHVVTLQLLQNAFEPLVLTLENVYDLVFELLQEVDGALGCEELLDEVQFMRPIEQVPEYFLRLLKEHHLQMRYLARHFSWQLFLVRHVHFLDG